MKVFSVDNQFSKVSSDVVVPVGGSKPKTWFKPTDQMDSWLDSQGFYRKHIARDASSLFRCVSEVVFLTQVHHLNVRKHCIQFALYQTDTLKKLTNTSVKDYVERLSNQREWGTTLDMEVMSLIYGLDFAIYKEIKKPLEKVTNNGFKFSIILSMSYEHHYDSVYPKQHIMDAAICQSILYEILYKQVFKLEEVDYAVNKMLHDKTARYQTELNMALFSSGFQIRLEMRDNCRNVKELLNYGITPFPYKVAKALDPNIYRNVEYDTWNEQRRGVRHMLSVWNNKELQVGSRCYINLNDKNQKVKQHGYIQQMSPNKGPVVVYVEELGEKLTVPHNSLELIPVLSGSEIGETDDDECMSETLSQLVIRDDDKKIENVENNLCRKPPTVENKSYPTSSIRELCNVHYVHPTTTVIPSTCYACVTSQTFQSENNNVKTAHVPLHSNATQERSKVSHEQGIMDQSTPMSMHYPVPMYPIVSPDMSVPPAVMPTNLIPSKTLTPNECIDNSSSVRMMYNRSVDSYYRLGYSTYPYCVIPSNVVYPIHSEPSVQSNVDTASLHYSYPLPQVPNEIMYALPLPSSATKNELPVYPATPLVHPAPTLNMKNSVAAAPAVGGIPASYPVVSSSICPVTYSPYSQPLFYHPYDYCITYPDVQGCENVTPTYPLQPYVPVQYTEEAYSANTQIYCQSLLPVSHAQ